MDEDDKPRSASYLQVKEQNAIRIVLNYGGEFPNSNFYINAVFSLPNTIQAKDVEVDV